MQQQCSSSQGLAVGEGSRVLDTVYDHVFKVHLNLSLIDLSETYRQHNDAAFPQDGVALGGGGTVGSLHHELALQPSGVLLRDDTAYCCRHQHIARNLQDLILADGCACGTGM